PIAPQNHWDLRIAAVVLTAKEKDVSSRVGMKRTVDTSVFYDGWLQSIPKDLRDIKKAINTKDFEKLGEISEANCLKMHATTLGELHLLINGKNEKMTLMETEQYLRKKGILVNLTMVPDRM